MPKLKLSYSYSLKKKQEEDTVRFLIVKNNEKVFATNESIFNLLTFFTKPQTKSAFFQTYFSHNSEAIPEVELFFKSLLDRRILVYEENTTQNEEGIRPPKFRFKKGDQVEQSTVIELLSERSDTEVYLIKSNHSDQHYVLKCLKSQYINQVHSVNTFAREFILLGQLPPHQKIRSLIQYEQGDKHYAVLEYINGVSIRRWLKSKRTLQNKIELISQLLEAFAHLHQNQIVHGDVHTSNFLVDQDNKAKLIDLGFALKDSEFQDENISTGGVFQYIPPEKMNTSSFEYIRSNPDYRSEIYQLGVLMHKILYDRYPYDAETWNRLRTITQSDKAIELADSSFGEVLPHQLIEILKTCLEKQPALRYHSAVELFQQWKTLGISS